MLLWIFELYRVIGWKAKTYGDDVLHAMLASASSEEVGIILLDNLCAGDKKLKLLDKNKILTYQQVKYKEYWGQEVMLN